MNTPAVTDPTEELAAEVRVGGSTLATGRPPRQLRIDEATGLLVPQAATALMLHRNYAP